MTETKEIDATPTVEQATVQAEGAGYHFAPDGDRLREKWGRTRWYWIGGVLLILLTAMPIIFSKPEDTVPLSTHNTGTLGARAVAEILHDQGVGVRQISRLSEARILKPAETTLVITFPVQLDSYQIDSILRYPGDIVFLGASYSALAAVDAGISPAGDAPYATRSAGCDNPHAIAAESIEWGGEGIEAHRGSSTDVCFLSDDGAGAWAAAEREGRTVTVFGDASLAMNGNLAEFGNAALVFRSVGANPEVVWYAPEFIDTSTVTWSSPAKPGDNNNSSSGGTTTDGPSPQQVSPQADYLPRGTGNIIFALALAALVAALWLGRRMGPIVSEPLPVVVHASEATRGRGRLYRRARAHGRASSALRASAARRIGSRLGVPRGADADALISAVSRVTGRDAHSVEAILYGPPPATDEAMMVLVQQLDNLESEVQRP